VEVVQKYKAGQAALERSRAQVRKAEQALAAQVGSEHTYSLKAVSADEK
jgi:hypothetical protein